MYEPNHVRPPIRWRKPALAAASIAAALLLVGVTLTGGQGSTPGAPTQVAGSAPGNVCVGGLPDADGNYVMQCHQDPASPTSSPTGAPTTTPPATTPPATTPPPAPTTPPATPTPTSGPLTGCIAHPGACGYPDATSAGPTVGTALTAYTGPGNITAANTVIEGKAITTCLTISAANVTIRNSVISDACFFMVETNGSGSLTIEHVKLTCTGHGNTAIGSAHISARWLDISGCENGFDADGTTTVRDSYIHNLFKGDSTNPAPHTDGIQVWPATSTSGPIVFTHNTVLVKDDNAAFTSGKPDDPTYGHGIQSMLTIDNNLFDGGSYTVYCSNNKGTLNGNRWGPTFLGTGYPAGHTDNCGTMTRTGNINDTTGAPLAL